MHQSVIKSEGFRSLGIDEPVEFEVSGGAPRVQIGLTIDHLQVEKDDMGRVRASKVTGPGGADVKGQVRRVSSRRCNTQTHTPIDESVF